MTENFGSRFDSGKAAGTRAGITPDANLGSVQDQNEFGSLHNLVDGHVQSIFQAMKSMGPDAFVPAILVLPDILALPDGRDAVARLRYTGPSDRDEESRLGGKLYPADPQADGRFRALSREQETNPEMESVQEAIVDRASTPATPGLDWGFPMLPEWDSEDDWSIGGISLRSMGILGVWIRSDTDKGPMSPMKYNHEFVVYSSGSTLTGTAKTGEQFTLRLGAPEMGRLPWE